VEKKDNFMGYACLRRDFRRKAVRKKPSLQAGATRKARMRENGGSHESAMFKQFVFPERFACAKVLRFA
jgi:hypothetical protein